MVTLNTLLLIVLGVVPATVALTVAFLLLIGVYMGVKDIRKIREEAEDNDSGVFTIPLNALGGMGRGISQADVDQARQAIAQQQRERATQGSPEDKKDAADPNTGTYL
jgi:hypothetical protein